MEATTKQNEIGKLVDYAEDKHYGLKDTQNDIQEISGMWKWPTVWNVVESNIKRIEIQPLDMSPFR